VLGTASRGDASIPSTTMDFEVSTQAGAKEVKVFLNMGYC
jgi:hypothetical protein